MCTESGGEQGSPDEGAAEAATSKKKKKKDKEKKAAGPDKDETTIAEPSTEEPESEPVIIDPAEVQHLCTL